MFVEKVSSLAEKNTVKHYEILASHNSVTEDSSLLGCDTIILEYHSAFFSVNAKTLQPFATL